jgi:hypothetical protein
MVRGAPVNVVAVIRHLGMKFRLSRPVERNGQRRRQGWMLSINGNAMAFLKDGEQTAAVATFKRLLERHAVDRGELVAAIDATVRDQQEAELPYR